MFTIGHCFIILWIILFSFDISESAQSLNELFPILVKNKMEFDKQYFCSVISVLLSVAYITPVQQLIVNSNGVNCLCKYFGLKYKEEYILLQINAKLVYEKDSKDDDISFNQNCISRDRSKYSQSQLIVNYALPVELSESTRLKVYKQKKLQYLCIGNFFHYLRAKFSPKEQYNLDHLIDILSI